MSTEVALDLLKATESVKSLTSVVNSSTSAWKATEAQMKSAGDYLGAAQAKYEGLGTAIEAQKAKIEALKNKQSEITGTTTEAAEGFAKYQSQIDKATTRLASMEAQQERAKSAVDLQKSGILDLNSSIKAQTDLMSATIRKQEAMNDVSGASHTKIESLTSINEKYEQVLSKEQEQLEKVRSASGETSDAYNKQATRVENLKTKIAENNNVINEERSKLSESAPSGFFNSLKEKLATVNAESEKTESLLSRAKAYFVGNVLANAFSTLSEKAKELASSGYEAAESATLVKERMEGVGLSEDDIESLTTQIKELKENTNMSADSVNKLQMRFYDNTHSIETAKTLTQGVASLEDQLKLTSSQSDSFSTSLNRIESSGTVTLSSLGKLEKSAPGFSTAFQKASGMSTSAFDSLVNSGKMTSSQFNDILAKASKNYKSNSATFNTTSEGAMHKLTQTWKDTQQSLMTPLVSVSAAGLTEISKVLSSSAMQKSITQLGQGIASLATKTTSLIAYLGKHQKDISSIVDSLMQIVKLIAVGAWNTFKGVVTGISDAFNDMTGNSKKTKEPLNSVATALKGIASHKEAIKAVGSVLVTAFAASKVLSGINGIAKGAMSLYKDLNTLKKAISGLWTVTKATGKLIGNGLKWTAKIAVSAAQLALKGLLKTAQLTGKGISAAFNFLKANPLIAIATGVAIAVVALIELYKHNAKFRKFVNDIVAASQELFKGVIKWFTQVWQDTVKIFTNLFNAVKPIFSAAFTVLGDYTKGFRNLFTGHWSALGTDVKKTINDLISFWKTVFTSGFNWLNSLTGGRLGDVLNTFSSIFESIKKVVSGAFTAIHDSFVDIVRGIIKPFNTLLDGLKKGINWILDKVGASKITADWSISLPSYSTGTSGGVLQDQLALVNDGKGSNYQEMYRTPDGQVGMFPATRNMIVPLKKGTEILNATDSLKLANRLGLNQYASGVGSWFSDIFNAGKDLVEDATSIVAHPVQFAESVFSKFASGISTTSSLASDVITKLPTTIASSAVNWIKSLFSGDSDNPSGSGASRWKDTISKVATNMEVTLSDTQMNKILWRINKESGGDPTIQNNWDSNAKAGHPSIGLLQYIQSTFDHWLPTSSGHSYPDNIKHGASQIAAMFNDSNWYSDISTSGGWGPTGKKRFENGGIVTNHSVVEVAEHNYPEAIIPLAAIKKAAATQVLDKVSSKIANEADVSSSSGSSSNYNSQLNELSSKFSSMLDLMKTQIQTTKDSAFNKNTLYRVSALDQTIASFQSIES